MTRKVTVLFIGFFVLALMAPCLSSAGSTLSWDAVTGDVTGYKIYYGTSSGSYIYSKDVGNATQYPLANLSLEEGTTYYFVVRAYNDTGESDNSGEASYTVPLPSDTTPPLAPQGVTASAADVNITLNWQANTESDLAGYKVYYGNSSRSYGPSIPAGNVTSYAIDNLEPGKTYYLAVAALDSAGNESGYSAEAVETIPSAPGGTPPVEGPALQWDAVTGAVTGYKVYYGTSSGSYPNSFDVGNVTQCSLSDLPLADGTTYYFVVKAYNNTGESDNSTEVSYSIGPTSPPPDTTAPTVAIAEPTSSNTYETSSSSIDLTGSSSDSVGVNQVSWTNSKGGSGTASGTTSWSISGVLLAEGDNVLTVTATDTAGNQSVDTIAVTYTPAGPPPAEGPALQWDAVTGDVTGYKVYYGTSTGSYPNSFDVGNVTQCSLSDLPLADGTTYYFVVKAYNNTGESDNSTEVSYSIGPTSPPPDTTAPTVAIAEPTSSNTYETSSSSIDLTGSSSDSVGVNQVSWTNSKGGSGTASGTTSWSISGVQLAEGDNVLTVTAKDAAGNKSTDTLTVAYTPPDTIDPSVSITSPTSGSSYETSSSSIDLSGSASDNDGVSQILWNNDRGGSDVASGTTSWSITDVDLAEGANLITVTATDASGNQSTDTLTVTYNAPDTVDPVVSITAPTSSSTYTANSSPINVSGDASDDVGVNQVTWVNDRGGSGTASGTTSWWISNLQLSENDNVLTVTATDTSGNQSTDTLTVTYTPLDTIDPSVSITGPTSGSTYTASSSSINLSGNALDNFAVSQVTWINDRGGSGTANGTSSWSISGIQLSEGDNVLTVTAKDAAGNQSSDTLTVSYTAPETTPPPDTTAPVVTIKSPTTRTKYRTKSSSINLSGTASDNVGVSQVTWVNSQGGSGTASGTSSWSISNIPLSKGDNILTVTATDSAGNQSSDTLKVTKK